MATLDSTSWVYSDREKKRYFSGFLEILGLELLRIKTGFLFYFFYLNFLIESYMKNICTCIYRIYMACVHFCLCWLQSDVWQTGLQYETFLHPAHRCKPHPLTPQWAQPMAALPLSFTNLVLPDLVWRNVLPVGLPASSYVQLSNFQRWLWLNTDWSLFKPMFDTPIATCSRRTMIAPVSTSRMKLSVPRCNRLFVPSSLPENAIASPLSNVACSSWNKILLTPTIRIGCLDIVGWDLWDVWTNILGHVLFLDFLVFPVISWYFLIFPVISWYFLIFPGISWYFLWFHGISWYFLIFPDISWYFLIFPDISWYLQVFPGKS